MACSLPDMVCCRQRHVSVIGGLLRDKYTTDPAIPYLRCNTQMAFSLDTEGVKRHTASVGDFRYQLVYQLVLPIGTPNWTCT